MQVLVTGHNGYIGSVMVPHLLVAGHKVIGLDTFYFEDCTLEEKSAVSIPFLRKDIRDVVSSDLLGFDAVIHLAGLSNDPLGDLNPELTYAINYHASVHLAKVAMDAGVKRFLFSSSCSMYGTTAGDDLVTEDAPLHPLTPYAISKVRTEEEISRLADRDFSPIFLRNATAYGSSPRLRADVVLNNLTCWAYTTGKVRIMSDGTPWRPVAHVEDISQAFALALTAPRDIIHDQAINIGVMNENYQVSELAEIVKTTVPGCNVEYGEHGGSDSRNYRVSFEKLSRLLPDFQPKWDARKGAQELYKVFLEVGLKLEDFQGRRYVRLNQLKYLIKGKYLDDTLRWTKVAN